MLSSLPPPDPTNPTITTTFDIQSAVYNSLSVIQEIVSLLEKEEDETLQKEVEKRRMRLGASRPEVLRKEVGKEIWSVSQVRNVLISNTTEILWRHSCLASTMKFLTTQTLQIICVEKQMLSCSNTNNATCTLCLTLLMHNLSNKSWPKKWTIL